ncbi:MAG: glycosyltransferase family 39 protein [Candidatus Nanoarchaeia archaeon]
MKQERIFWIFVIISILVHIYAMTFPLATLEDESFHVERAIYSTQILDLINPLVLTFLILLSIGFLFLLYKLYSKKVNYFLLVLIPIAIIYYFLINYFAIRFSTAQFGSLDLNNFSWLVRYGSIGTVVYTLQLFVFGYKEWAMRLFPLIFSVLASFMMYKLVLLYKNENWALFSAISLLFMPGFFYFVNISQPTTGVIFFTLTSLYFLLKYVKQKEQKHLIYMTLFLILGFQYKETFFLIYGIIFSYLIYLYLIKEKDINFKKILKYIFLSLIPLILWLIVQMRFNANPSASRIFFLDSSLFTFTNFFRYIIHLPEQVTLPLTILFLISLPFISYNIFKKRDQLSFIFLVYFLIHFVFFTKDNLRNFMVVYRYGADLIPPVAYLSFFFLEKFDKKEIIRFLSYGLVLFLLVSSCFLTYNHWEKRFIPMDGTFSYIKENVPEDAKILKTMAPNPYKFYMGKYELKQEFKHEVWKNSSEQNITNLYSFMKNNNYTYFIFPNPIISYQSYWPTDYGWVTSWVYKPELKLVSVLNESLLYNLEINNTYFDIVYREELGPNALYLIKIR